MLVDDSGDRHRDEQPAVISDGGGEQGEVGAVEGANVHGPALRRGEGRDRRDEPEATRRPYRRAIDVGHALQLIGVLTT